MNTKRTFGLCMIIMLVSIALTCNVYALGVAPSKNIIDIERAGLEYTGSVINNENKELNVVIIAQGEYAKYVSIPDPYLSLSADEKEKEFKYTLSLPNDLPPGPTTIILLVAELPDRTTTASGTNIQSLLSVEHQVIINVPYPGIYAEGVFFINEADVNETINFAVNVINKGTEEIKNVNGELIIRGPTNDEIKRIKSNFIPKIASKTSDKLYVDYVANMNPGIYYAEFIVKYNDKQFVLRKTFTVDKMSADISNVDVVDFKLGYISRVDIDVLNRWNQPIPEAYAYLQVLNEKGEIVSETKTASSTLNQLTTTTLSGYWDTKGVNVGSYDMKVILYYNDKFQEKLFKTVIGIDDIRIADSGTTGLVTGSKEKDGSTPILYILVVGLLFINGFLVFVYFKYIRKKNPPQNNT